MAAVRALASLYVDGLGAKTLQDVRDFVDAAERLGFAPDTPLEEGLFLCRADLSVESIACGEHVPPLPNDVLVQIHLCKP